MMGVDAAAHRAFVAAIAAEHETDVTPDLIDAAEAVLARLARLAIEGWFLVRSEMSPESKG